MFTNLIFALVIYFYFFSRVLDGNYFPVLDKGMFDGFRPAVKTL